MPAKSSCRLRKVACSDCGYTARITRSWLEVGLPGCPCGGELEPTAPADLAFIGRITADDMPDREWTIICRENGWDDSILRKGAAAKAFSAREHCEGGLRDRIGRTGAEHCSYAGCGRWIADGANQCSAGHAQHGVQLEACPF